MRGCHDQGDGKAKTEKRPDEKLFMWRQFALPSQADLRKLRPICQFLFVADVF